MCGIVGYVGNKKATPILINGLLCLEYRGYDSAGIATIEKDKIKAVKDQGRVKNLYNLNDINKLEGTIGIAHTRWATHGKPSKENAHPHLDNSNAFAVVHNGIIENYHKLREFLISKGYTFVSETDTEVIPNLIHYYFNNGIRTHENRFLSAVKSALDVLKGSYAVLAISSLFPDEIIVARKDSPLVIGSSKDAKYIASDIPAILNYSKNFYLLDDNELAIIHKDSIHFFDSSLTEHNKVLKNIEWDNCSAQKDGFEDFMIKEIFEQPKAVRETIGARLALGEKCNFEDLSISKETLTKINKIYIIACGTAMHAGLVRKGAYRKAMSNTSRS